MLSEDQFNTWIEALESGKYKQGKNVLRQGENFCCLGVLADTLGAKWRYTGENFDYCRIAGDESASFIPSSIINRGAQYPLSAMNDNGKTFEEIAAHLKEHKHAYVSPV